ncbi:helix-turn-helix transcriptional regulator [Streptomyces sp. A7024]|uniref:Helix-turn-helix transcriptional regulator n=1 Tax=Streptomyces coryli TaxID=1128680 RepID=A0A6G4TRU5_9ACTN|nr:helix-turn-helix domain-containing protein [Streptomyces coryli]NGN62512.1 helix-turn-helix transcriptional regulator [Streptomyces coryli]
MTQHAAVVDAPSGFGGLLRWWRATRRMSQLDLASEAMTTPRYVSFVETGRAQPSRQMVIRLARALDVPLRDRNGLLLAAGYAPLYARAPLDDPELARVEAALSSMLAQHEPFPAVVMDRRWDVLRANQGAQRLFGRLLAPDPMPTPANVLQLMIGPGPVRDHVANWTSVVPALLERARREAVGGILDTETAALVDRLRTRPEVAALMAAPEAPTPSAPTAPVLDVRFAWAGTLLSFFSVISTLGTPTDVTAQELRVEAFFPADEPTRRQWHRSS